MSHKIFSIRIPMEIASRLEAEASKEERTLNRQLTVILRDRYDIPLINSPKSQKAGVSRTTTRARRKDKTALNN